MSRIKNNTKMRRWKKVVIWCASIVLVLGVAGLFAVNYAIDKVIDSMANSLEAELEEQIDQELETAESALASDIPEASEEPDKVNPEASTEPAPSPETESSAPANNEEQPASAPADSKAAIGEYSSDVTLEKANSIKNNITVGDKADVTSILVGNLSLSDLKLFQALASGGMSVEEKREARKVLLDKLTPEEYNTLSTIAKKYGVSRGKSYDEMHEEEERQSNQ